MAHPGTPIHLATFYTDIALGQLGLGALNATGRAKGTVQAYHRGNVTEDGSAPFAVVNDFIGSSIGRLLGLPIPPGAITRSAGDERPLYSCLDFDCLGETLVSAEADKCVEHMLDVSTGTVMFDILIANPDRMPWNLKADSSTSPTLVRLYDHADSLFGVEGESRLDRLRFSLGLSWPNLPRDDHFLLKYLADGRWRDKWYHRIESLPDGQIEDICDAAMAAGITKTQANAVAKFLIYRKQNFVKSLIDQHKSAFPPDFFNPPQGALI